jgi:hypothetical protein
MKYRTIAALALTGMFPAIALAQGQPALIPPDQGPGVPQSMSAPLADFNVGMLVVEPSELTDPIEKVPYSADMITEMTQELPDGNRIERRTTGAVARDSRGRVRRDQQLTAIGPVPLRGDARMITISDPVAGVHYSLDPARKLALQSQPLRRATASKGADVSAPKGVPGKPAAMDVRTEQLGTKEYEGVRAEGTRTIATLPAGTVGNVRRIEITSERWYSRELGVVVLSRRADPRYGETIYRLTNIKREEPDSALFQVPADYKLEPLRPLR